VQLNPDCPLGYFFAPRAYRIDALSRLEREVFGPILHVVEYAADRLDDVIDAVNRTGYGLTLGIHTRIDGKAGYIAERLHVGNAYVNRNMIGAVVGVQPFGGEGLSGTGPKAGGPRYLHRFATERTLSIDTTASGGNASLLSLNEEGL
jgi:RHH-type proline utilization regulon transcriptional repressor/proline dehydrogenase/delta 1-pyrroline-5-carboxylate dehydrogenase